MEETKILVTEEDLGQLVRSIRMTYGYEFGEYAVSSFSRRVSRYMEMNGMEVVSELIFALRSKPTFETFLKEITVNTTDLFRDPAMWLVLKNKILPKLFKKNERIRIWHAACSTGEEVLSMCILLSELGLLDRADLVASDINDDVIEVAKSGRYMGWRVRQYARNFNQVFEDVPLDKYYEMVASKAIFNKDLLRNVRYKNFDLVLDTPFSGYDLVLIRNVLIYFNMDLQEKVLANINRSMKSKGYLVLGAQESINWHKASDNLMAINNDFKIYKKLRDSGEKDLDNLK